MHITELIKSGSNEQLEKSLIADPKLSEILVEGGVSIFLFALYHRNQKAAELIRKHKSSMDLYEAVCAGEQVLVEKIIQGQPGLVNTPSTDGFFALGYACFFDHMEIAHFLIDSGAKIDMPSVNEFKVTPLHSACAISNYALTELLLKRGADVNARQKSGITPLHSAAFNGKSEIAHLLLNYGADSSLKTDTGELPADIATKRSFPKTAEVIRLYGRATESKINS